MAEYIELRSDGPLARITINRPPVNVLSTGMLEDLDRAFRQIAADDRVRLVRLDAEGKVFSAGVDVADHVGDKIPEMMDALTRLFETMEAIEQPTISVVHGAALGGGCEVVLGTDLCYASEKASFGLPEISLGLFAPPASVLLPRLVGERRALEILLSGEKIRAREAEQMGLVNRVFAPEHLQDEVESRLGKMLEHSGCALRFAKRAVRVARGLPPIQAHRKVQRLYMNELMLTADASEGLEAFMGKRPPVWKHV